MSATCSSTSQERMRSHVPGLRLSAGSQASATRKARPGNDRRASRTAPRAHVEANDLALAVGLLEALAVKAGAAAPVEDAPAACPESAREKVQAGQLLLHHRLGVVRGRRVRRADGAETEDAVVAGRFGAHGRPGGSRHFEGGQRALRWAAGRSWWAVGEKANNLPRGRVRVKPGMMLKLERAQGPVGVCPATARRLRPPARAARPGGGGTVAVIPFPARLCYTCGDEVTKSGRSAGVSA